MRKITKREAFTDYLRAKGYTVISIDENQYGVTARLRYAPHLKDFTQVKRLKVDLYTARLSSADFNNENITDNLFQLEY
jgi:alpha-beta hydrolase superfamily lysophospholipase